MFCFFGYIVESVACTQQKRGIEKDYAAFARNLFPFYRQCGILERQTISSEIVVKIMENDTIFSFIT